MKNRCSLCGGELRAGICTECGMNNKKSDDMYKHQLNSSSCDKAGMSHIHEDAGNIRQMPKQAQSTARGRASKVQPQAKQQKSGYSGGFVPARYTAAKGEKPKQKSRITVIVILASIIIPVVTAFVNIYEDRSVSVEENRKEFTQDETEYDPYAYAEGELKEEGEHWEAELPAGMYMAGVDIPEGEYTVTGQEGNSYGVFNAEHNLYVNETFGKEEYQIEKAEGVKLFAGTVVIVDGMFPVSFSTENGQVQELKERIANPVTESFQISGKALAGQDFLPGTYDIVAIEEESGIFRYNIYRESADEDYPLGFSVYMEKNPTAEYPIYCSVYKNVVLPEGAVIEADNFKVKLVPSEGVTTENYKAFYGNFY